MSQATTEPRDKSITDLARTLVEENKIELPPLPELAMKLRTMLSDEDVNTADVAKLMATDPAITSMLLRRANSAAFGGLSEITDIAQAVARLGLKQVETLVTTMAMKGAFEVSDPDKQEYLRHLWDHSLIVALSAQRIAESKGFDPESTFLAGLMHDIGRLVVLKGIDDLQKDNSIEITQSVLEELMDTLHCELGQRALEAWNLSEELQHIARDHEEICEDSNDLAMLAVQASDAIACKLGFHPDADPELTLLEEPSVELLNLGDIELATLMVDLEDEFEALRSML